MQAVVCTLRLENVTVNPMLDYAYPERKAPRA